MKISEWNAGRLNSTEIRELLRQQALDKTGDNITGDVTCPLPSGTESIANKIYVDNAVMNRAKWIGKYIPLEGYDDVLWETVKIDKTFTIPVDGNVLIHTFQLDDGIKRNFGCNMTYTSDFSKMRIKFNGYIPSSDLSECSTLTSTYKYPWNHAGSGGRISIPDSTESLEIRIDNMNRDGSGAAHFYVGEISIYFQKTLFDLMEERGM